MAVKNNLAGSLRNDTGENLHQRRFAGAVFSEQRRHLTPVNVEVDAFQSLDAAVGLRDVSRGKHHFASVGVLREDVTHLTSSFTGVIIQFFGLMSRKTPTRSIDLPERFATSIGSSTAFFIARLIPEPAS
jgi:hypothetical protein